MISTKGRYSIRILLDLAEHRNGSYIPMKDVAARQNISLKYIERLMPALKAAGLVDSVHGIGGVYTNPVSHGEGRFLCSEELVRKLADNGQIVTQYVDERGVPGMDVDVNPNGSVWAVEGITSPDGRVLGKMGHSERIADGIYRNISGVYDMKLFASAKKYFD